jgi:hypothetical protein
MTFVLKEEDRGSQRGNSFMRSSTLLALAVIGALATVSGAHAQLAAGTMLDQSNAAAAKDLLPPEIYAHYEKGQYANVIVDFPDSAFQWDDTHAEATAWNREHLVLDENKVPVDKDTGKKPEYITGTLFPDIKEDDPDAAYKILWNTTYTVYIGGNSRNTTSLNWISPTGVERSAVQDVIFLYYDGQPKRLIPPKNPDNLLFQFLALTTSPADLQGTAALSWRYNDADKRDASWAYVPALRRVRGVSPTNRSDGFLGSDLSQDDGNFFDGKPQDFEWKLVGLREGLRITDPDALAGKVKRAEMPGGGWRTTFENNDRTVGFQVADWKGIAWAPVAAGLTKRKMWVIEGVPKDKYYLYGKIELWIDSYTYEGAWNRKFSWTGELMNTYQISGPPSAPFNATERWLGSTFGYQCAENVKANRATLAGLVAPGDDVGNDRRQPLQPSFFDFSTLSRFGK